MHSLWLLASALLVTVSFALGCSLSGRSSHRFVSITNYRASETLYIIAITVNRAGFFGDFIT